MATGGSAPICLRKLELELNAGLRAAEVLAEAEREAARVESEMAVIARQYWALAFPGKPIPLDDREGRSELIKRVLDAIGSEHGTPETLVADVRGTVADIKAFITANRILKLNDPDRCRIVEMPEFLRGNSVAYLNPRRPWTSTARANMPSARRPRTGRPGKSRAISASTTGRCSRS